MALQLRSRGRTLGNPSLIHFFSTTSSSNPPSPDSNDSNGQSDSSNSESSISSYFSDFKASLRNRQPSSPPEPRISKSPNHQPSLVRPSKLASLEEISKNLGEFRRRTTVPSPDKTNSTPSSSDSSLSQNFSLQDSYKPHVVGKTGDAEGGLSAIRESLRQLSPTSNTQKEKAVDPMSLSAFKNTLKSKLTDSSWPADSSSPSMVFVRESLRQLSPTSNTQNEKAVDPVSLSALKNTLKLKPTDSSSPSKVFVRESLRQLSPTSNTQDEKAVDPVSLSALKNTLKLKPTDSSSPSKVFVRESLRQLSPTSNTQDEKAVDPMSLSALKNTLQLKPTDSSWPTNSSSPSKVFGVSEPLVFGRESREKKDGHSSNAMRTEFVKVNNYGELGEKLRPEAKGEGCFSSGELNDRLIKLGDMEEKETGSKVGGFSFTDLTDRLATLMQSKDEK